MDAIHFCHVHHSCVQGVAWVRQWNETHHPQKLTLLQAFDIAPTGRWCTWAWLACARRHSICNMFNLIDTELHINFYKTMTADDARDTLTWAMAESCMVLYIGLSANDPTARQRSSQYLETVLGVRDCAPYDDICDAMQGKVSSIIKANGRPDIEAYDRDHI